MNNLIPDGTFEVNRNSLVLVENNGCWVDNSWGQYIKVIILGCLKKVVGIGAVGNSPK